jgi:hypothetical protein
MLVWCVSPPKIHQIFWFFCGSPPPGSLWTIMKTCCASGGFILVVSHHDASETPTDVSEALSISLHACWPVEKREALNDMSLLMEWQPPFYVCIPWLPTTHTHDLQKCERRTFKRVFCDKIPYYCTTRNNNSNLHQNSLSKRFPLRTPHHHHDHSNQEYTNESAFRSSRFGVDREVVGRSGV